jgi:hypothetical protein
MFDWLGLLNWLKSLFSFHKQRKVLADHIVDQLRLFDYYPQLEIVRFSFSGCSRHVFLSDGKHSHPKNPTTYIVNQGIIIFQYVDYSNEILSIIIAMRWIRRRAQSGDIKPEPFPCIEVSDKFAKRIESLLFETWDEYEADAEIVGRIAAAMKMSGKFTNEEISEIATMDASLILSKVGVKIIEVAVFL